jgi:hypothetical protein
MKLICIESYQSVFDGDFEVEKGKIYQSDGYLNSWENEKYYFIEIEINGDWFECPKKYFLPLKEHREKRIDFLLPDDKQTNS